MKNRLKKLLSIALVLILIVGLVPVSASALDASGKIGENVNYTFNSSTGLLTISGSGAMYNYNYTNNKSPFFEDSNIKTVIIEPGITHVGNDMFFRCTGITDATLPDSVTSIGEGVFAICSSLVNVNIPNGVTSLAYDTFTYCSSLQSIVLPDNLTSIGESVFYSCTCLTNISLPDGLVNIGINAFYDCANLTSIELPDSVTTVGSYAFYGCTNLASVKISDSVTTISNGMLSGCTNLTSVTIPDGVTLIGDRAFFGCTNLTSVTISDSVTVIAPDTFRNCIGLTSIEIPDSVTSLGDFTFYGCIGLTNVRLSSGITYIGSCTFYNCCSLSDITIPDSVTNIYANAFYGCTSLTSAVIPNSVTSIAGSAFHGCTSLTSVEIPDSVTSIENGTFYNCTSLESVTIPVSVTHVLKSAFHGCSSLTDVHYDGTSEDWDNVTVQTDNDPLLNAIKHFAHPVHTPVIDAAVPATCTQSGLTAGSHCQEGGEILVAQQVIPALGHNEVIDASVPATCISTGLTAGSHCSRCGVIIVAQQVTPIADHTAGRPTLEAVEGAEKYVVRCTVCNKVLTISDSMSADYTAVDSAVEKANAIDADEYYDISALEYAVNSVEYGLDISSQGAVDEAANAINEAIANLKKISDLLVVNRGTAYQSGKTITIIGDKNAVNVAFKPALSNGETFTLSDSVGLVKCSDGRNVAKSAANAKLTLQDGREYDLVVKEFEVYFEKQDIKTMYVNTDTITVDNENRTIYMESNADAGYVVIYNLINRTNITLQNAELYTSYRYKINKNFSGTVTTTVIMDGIDYALTVRFVDSVPFDGSVFKTTYVQSFDIDAQNKTITIQSNKNAKRVVIADSASGYTFGIDGESLRNHRYYIEKPAEGEYHGTATISDEQFVINIYFN